MQSVFLMEKADLEGSEWNNIKPEAQNWLKVTVTYLSLVKHGQTSWLMSSRGSEGHSTHRKGHSTVEVSKYWGQKFNSSQFILFKKKKKKAHIKVIPVYLILNFLRGPVGTDPVSYRAICPCHRGSMPRYLPSSISLVFLHLILKCERKYISI